MVETDYCGIMTGKKTDKAALFDVFYGDLETAPMIGQCPVNMELRLHDVLDFPTHDIFIGELVQTYVKDIVTTEGKIDIAKIRPLLFDMASMKYWGIGIVSRQMLECRKISKKIGWIDYNCIGHGRFKCGS